MTALDPYEAERAERAGYSPDLPPRQVPYALAQLEKLCAELRESVNDLHSRLVPVLSDDAPEVSEGSTVAAVRPVLVPVADRVSSCADTVRWASDMVQGMLRRLEL